MLVPPDIKCAHPRATRPAATLALQPRLHLLLKRELLVALAPLAVVPFVAWLVFNRGKNVKIRRLMEKDAVLVAYQEATGQRDRQAAVRALEQHNWNLEVRIRSLEMSSCTHPPQASLRSVNASAPQRVAIPRDRTLSLWRFIGASIVAVCRV